MESDESPVPTHYQRIAGKPHQQKGKSNKDDEWLFTMSEQLNAGSGNTIADTVMASSQPSNDESSNVTMQNAESDN